MVFACLKTARCCHSELPGRSLGREGRATRKERRGGKKGKGASFCCGGEGGGGGGG